MSLEIIIGPMKSAKTTTLIERASAFKAVGTATLLINHSCDTRYGSNVIANHNKTTLACISSDSLLPFLTTKDFEIATWILIEEAHFFEDLREFIEKALDAGKRIIIAGLSGDWQRKPFGQILDCIPLADTICHKTAMCELCGDGTPALFSRRTDKSHTEQVLVGGSDKYIAVCRKHYAQ